MATCSPQTLLSLNPCYSSLTSEELKIVQIGILCGIIAKLDGGPDVSCDIQTQFTDNPCLFTLTGDQLETILTQLLCELADRVTP